MIITTEQKARAYDKALEKFRPIYELAKRQGRNIDIEEFEDIFPELKGSEEERIVACIDLVLSDAPEDRFKDYNVSLKQCYDWLEKQKNLIEQYEDDLDRCACENFDKGYQKAKEHLSSQNYCKPAEWSKEDKKMLKSAIQQMSIFEEYIDDGSFFTERAKQASKEACCSVRNWLKSLSPKEHWKPTQQQLEALQWCGDKIGGSTGQNIRELLKELKKL